MYNTTPDAGTIFNDESSGVDIHPALHLYADGSSALEDEPQIFLDSTGTYDANNTEMPARAVLGSAICNLHPNLKKIFLILQFTKALILCVTTTIWILSQACIPLCSLGYWRFQ